MYGNQGDIRWSHGMWACVDKHDREGGLQREAATLRCPLGEGGLRRLPQGESDFVHSLPVVVSAR